MVLIGEMNRWKLVMGLIADFLPYPQVQTPQFPLHISYLLQNCKKGKPCEMDLPYLKTISQILNLLLRCWIDSRNMQSGLVTCLLEIVQVLKRSKFLCSPLVITRLVLFQIYLWDTIYFCIAEFVFYSSKTFYRMVRRTIHPWIVEVNSNFRYDRAALANRLRFCFSVFIRVYP